MQDTAAHNPSGEPRGLPPSYKIIYNWDGGTFWRSEYPQSLDRWLEKTYAPIKDTQVDALFWCVGADHADWPSPTMEMVGDSVGRVYGSVGAMRSAENTRVKFEGDGDPYGALVDRGHELGLDVFASIRMNDNHFYGLTPADVKGGKGSGVTQVRRDHPDWLLGGDHEFAASWNYAIHGVRAYRLQHITEACNLAGWDGLELDWQRHGYHLRYDLAYRLRYTMTDMVRAAREVTDRIAEQRGRPFYLAVRVAATLEACRNIGYDIRAWVDERLCDYVIAGGTSGTDPGVEVEAFAEMVDGAGARFYGGFDSDGRQQARRLVTRSTFRHDFFRATAQAYWDRGVDGIYTFNWGANETTRRDMLTTIGSPDTLSGLDKIYASVRRGGGTGGRATNDRIYGETPVTLHETLTGTGPTFEVPVHDDVVRQANAGRLASVELHVEMGHFSPSGDEVEIALDGTRLTDVQVRNVAGPDPDRPSDDKVGVSDVDENSWLVYALGPDQADRGLHHVEVRLVKRDPRIAPPLSVENVEVYVRYKAKD